MSEPTRTAPGSAPTGTEVGQANGKHDVTTHRIVVVGLVLAVLTSVLGIVFIDSLGHEVPPSLPAIGGTALGALTGMVAAIMRGSG
jgi:hypothetical protein